MTIGESCDPCHSPGWGMSMHISASFRAFVNHGLTWHCGATKIVIPLYWRANWITCGITGIGGKAYLSSHSSQSRVNASYLTAFLEGRFVQNWFASDSNRSIDGFNPNPRINWNAGFPKDHSPGTVNLLTIAQFGFTIICSMSKEWQSILWIYIFFLNELFYHIFY